MYLCAKLVGIATAILSAGTVSPLVIPYLKNTNSWLFSKDSSTHGYDFQELDSTAEKRLKKLEHWLSRFSSAKTASEGLKQLELEKMQPLFEKIFATETEIQALFEQITKSLSDLVEKNENLTSNSIKRLEQQKQQQLQKTLNEKYSIIKEALKKWKESLNEINCAIDKQNKEKNGEEGQCKQWTSEITNFFESVSSLFSSLMSQMTGGAQNGQQHNGDTQQAGGEKAKADLKKVKEELLQAINNFNKQRGMYQVLSAYSKSKEQVATILLATFNTIVQSLNEQIETLRKSIQESQTSSQEKSKQIDETQQKLEGSYKDYLRLQHLESLFQWWSETFKEKVTKNQDDIERETNLKRRRKK